MKLHHLLSLNAGLCAVSMAVFPAIAGRPIKPAITQSTHDKHTMCCIPGYDHMSIASAEAISTIKMMRLYSASRNQKGDKTNDRN